MTDTAKRLAGPTSVPNSETTLYTVPGATTATLLGMRIVNTTGSDATIKMSIGPDAAGTRILSDYTVLANDAYDWQGFLVLAAGETLRATGGTNNALTATVSGIETT